MYAAKMVSRKGLGIANRKSMAIAMLTGGDKKWNVSEGENERHTWGDSGSIVRKKSGRSFRAMRVTCIHVCDGCVRGCNKNRSAL